MAVTTMAVAILLLFQETFIDLRKDFVEGEGPNPEDEVHINLRHLGVLDVCCLIDGADLSLHFLQVLGGNEVRLVEQDAVRKCHLLNGFVHDAIWFVLPKVLQDMLCIHDRQDAVELHVGLHKVVGEEGLGDRRRICQASRLDDDAIQRLALARRLLVQLLEACDEVATHCATNAPVVHLDDVLLCDTALGVQQRVIDANLSKLILDYGNLLAVVCLENVVQQGCLARPKEAGDDGYGGLVVAFRSRR
mmetsp:Transcript_9811/g.25396  ORF Transcript_9811/g.25396 Transcript_9811/m.25396 type:complete len:248 (+) Transcript_9811:602-1345(+)